MLTQASSGDGEANEEDTSTLSMFSPADHAFVVAVPGNPRRMPRMAQDDRDRLQQYQLVTPDRSYFMQSLDYGSAPVDRAGAMESLQTEALGNNGTLISSKAIFLNGLKGREVMVQLPGGVIRGTRYVITDTKLCQVMITTSASNRGAITTFLESFRLM
jgi:hypothetical protein